MRLVLHEETGPESYDQLSASLLVSHSLSNYQKMEGMKLLPPLRPPSHIANPVQRFNYIHIDLVGPLPGSADGHMHLFTVVDRSTC
jgi:hypothetical protein